ncbi:MAG: hypothetical protein NTU51_06065 [Bacteroidetes bacterium]|nr:hypothetical protein [Bacteroidota bacterium]
MSEDALHMYLHRFPQVRVRKGGGPGCPALLNYDLLRSDIKQRLQDKYGDLHQASKRNKLIELIQPDFKASTFFSEYLFDDGTSIKPDRQVEYNANASILNAVGHFVGEKSARRRGLGGKTTGIWQAVSEAVNNLDKNKYQHTLPSNALRLKEKYRNYGEHGYIHLIHKGIGNCNARKMNDAAERLIISIYCQDNLPFGAWVYDTYLQFIYGHTSIVDRETGSMFNREDFFDNKRGTYIVISKSTVWNIINNPANAIIIDRMRNNRIDHITKNTPYNHRKAPQYSLSKISMDDRTLSRKTSDGKWLNAYLAFDVLSDSILSCVYTTGGPDLNLVWECFREMYRNLNTNCLMWPGEVEVENHLMKDIEHELNAMFSYVTFCAPGLSRSKRAEHKIRSKKYGDEKKNQVGIGRWNGKGAYKTKSENKDEDYKQPRIPVEQLIEEDRQSIQRFNSELHPNQKLFPGKTRWQVLLENQNPDLGRPQKHKLFRYLGIQTKTSIRNNDFAQVMYGKYAIDNQNAIIRLKPNNYTVQAYYVPEHDGGIPEVYLYQDDTFITRATKIEEYNEAKIERTDRDEQIRTEQAKRQAHFFKVEKDGLAEKVTRKLAIIKTSDLEEIPAIVETVPSTASVPTEENIEDMIAQYNNGWESERALESI